MTDEIESQDQATKTKGGNTQQQGQPVTQQTTPDLPPDPENMTSYQESDQGKKKGNPLND